MITECKRQAYAPRRSCEAAGSKLEGLMRLISCLVRLISWSDA